MTDEERKARQRAYYHKNKAKIKVHQKRYYQANKEKILASNRARYQKSRGGSRKTQTGFWAKMREKLGF